MNNEIENEDDAHIRFFQGVMVASVLTVILVIVGITVWVLLK